MRELTKNVTVLYDAECDFCRWVIGWVLRWDTRRQLNAEPIQGPIGGKMLADLSPEERLASWHAVDALGRRASGGAAFALLLSALPGGRPLARLAKVLPAAAEGGYRFAAHRRRYWKRLLSHRAIERADSLIRRRRS